MIKNPLLIDDNGHLLEGNGGRDTSLMGILAKQMNFTFEYFDPAIYGVKRSRGSSWGKNYTFPGILGQIHNRQEPFHMYLGDTTQTYTRNSAVDYSYQTLPDSGAFVIKAPTRLNPPDLLLRPYNSLSWLLIGLSFAFTYLVLFISHRWTLFQAKM